MRRSPSETIHCLTLDETVRLFRASGIHRRDRAIGPAGVRYGHSIFLWNGRPNLRMGQGAAQSGQARHRVCRRAGRVRGSAEDRAPRSALGLAAGSVFRSSAGARGGSRSATGAGSISAGSTGSSRSWNKPPDKTTSAALGCFQTPLWRQIQQNRPIHLGLTSLHVSVRRSAVIRSISAHGAAKSASDGLFMTRPIRPGMKRTGRGWMG